MFLVLYVLPVKRKVPIEFIPKPFESTPAIFENEALEPFTLTDTL